MIFNTWKKFDQLNSVIKTLWIVIAILVCINLMLFWGWKSAPQKLHVYLPPDLSQGAMIRPEQIPKSTVYAFGYQIFTAINTWSNDGQEDYRKNLEAYKNYMSVKFYHQLFQDYQTRASTGALSRKRLMSGFSGSSYEPSEVKVLGSGTWLVDMRLHIIESVGPSVVKDVVMDYPLIISRVHESIQINPWDLVIVGFYKQPYRVKTNI